MSHLGGLLKDNTGYHLPSLVCGSEGTLAVVTAARLAAGAPSRRAGRRAARLRRPSTGRSRRAPRFAARSPTLEAAELFFADGVALVREQLALPPPPVVAEVYLLVECADQSDPSAELAAAVARPRVWSTRRSRSIQRSGPRCGATARATPKRSTRSVRRTSSTSRCPHTSLAVVRRRGARASSRRSPPTHRCGSSATRPTATSTST